MKNMEKATVLKIAEQVEYSDGQVVSKTLQQNAAVSITLFAFDEGEEISTHAAGGDALLPVEGRVHVAAARQQESVAGQRLGYGGVRVGKRYPVYLGTSPGQTFHIF